MLELRHLTHLDQLDMLMDQIIQDGSGLVVVAGLNPRPELSMSGSGFLPSGRTTVLRMLVNGVLETHPGMSAIVVARDEKVVRVPRHLRRRVRRWFVQPPDTYGAQISAALRKRPGLLIIDRLCEETAPFALRGAQEGFRVFSQMDTVFRGADVPRHLCDLGVQEERFGGLSWVVSVQRMPTLCPHCRQPSLPDWDRLDSLCQRYPGMEDQIRAASFVDAPGCSKCNYTGRKGNLMVFDVYRGGTQKRSVLSLGEYVLRMALDGRFSLGDVFGLDTDQLHRTYSLLAAGERALAEANATLRRKVVELETANRVLERRTEALVSLQEIGQALLYSNDLYDMAERVCRRVGELCGADRSIIYFRVTDGQVKVLAAPGWGSKMVSQILDPADAFLEASLSGEPKPFLHYPPGASPVPTMRSGLCVALVAQQEWLGAMVVQSTKREAFAPGEVALLRTFASQAALSLQRAGLIDQLRIKIELLEAAQAGLAQKERLERELELAREVQQSVLPRIFPQVEGYAFAVSNRPARRVGGDFYDVVALDDKHIGLVIADVSDKGMAAALYMALTRSLWLAEARRVRSPLVALERVNTLLVELGQPGMFVSVFYAILDTTTRRLTYVRAGHDRPLVLRNHTLDPLQGQGMCLGLCPTEELGLSEEQTTLHPGDTLVLYTDGMTDVVSPDGKLYDLNRLRSLLLGHAALPPQDLCSATFRDLDAYRGEAEQYDDMTMLVLAVNGVSVEEQGA